MGQVVQICGSVLILVSFGLAQLRRMSTQSRRYLMLNLAGSAILAANAAAGAQWGFLLLEGAWALVSLLGLAVAARRRWHGPGRRCQAGRTPVEVMAAAGRARPAAAAKARGGSA